MNYAQIDEMEYCNGEGIGVSLFVSGCPYHCKNCFNSIAWDYNYGKPFTDKTMDTILELLKPNYIKRFSLLGGEPLANQNVETVFKILDTICNVYPNKKIWLYTGNTYENIMNDYVNNYNNSAVYYRFRIVNFHYADVLVDGQYVDELKDLNLHFKGSSNQRLIDLNKSTKDNIVLYEVTP